MRVTAILACHNRRQLTLRCLEGLRAQNLGEQFEIDAVVVDDGSDDGTREALARFDSFVEVVEGGGDLYWSKAMALAESVARIRAPDYLLWLNDDVVLDPSALATLLDVAVSTGPRTIVVGGLRDPEIGRVTYSGVRRIDFHPLRFELIEPRNKPVFCETFNGNVVLVPRDAYEALGGIDGAFAHAAADFDYGLRARQLGFDAVVAPFVGTCARSPVIHPWRDESLGARERWRLLVGRKGLPPRSQARYLRRHGGPVWPLFWLAPYVRAAFSFASSFHRREAAR